MQASSRLCWGAVNCQSDKYHTELFFPLKTKNSQAQCEHSMSSSRQGKQSGNSLPQVANHRLWGHFWPLVCSCAVQTDSLCPQFRLGCLQAKELLQGSVWGWVDYLKICGCRECCSKPNCFFPLTPVEHNKLLGAAFLPFLISSFSTETSPYIHLKLCPSNKDYKEFTLFSAWREIKY